MGIVFIKNKVLYPYGYKTKRNKLHMNNITVLFPGGFKPMHGAHLDLIMRYHENPNVSKIIVFISKKERNSISQEISIKIAKHLLKKLNKVSIVGVTDVNPVTPVYKFMETASGGIYALCSSQKDLDYERVKEFVNNYSIYGKYYRSEINVIEFAIDTKPLCYINRADNYNNTPISSTILRKDLYNSNIELFKTNYPQLKESEILKIWCMLKNKYTLDDCKPVNILDLQSTYNYVCDNILNAFNIYKNDITPIGSYGKKRLCDMYGDIDIAININSIINNNKHFNIKEFNVIETIYNYLTLKGFHCSIIKAFNQISFACPICGNIDNGVVQVDFMLSKDLEFSKYAYYSPSYKESKYKGVYRGFLLMAIVSEFNKKTIMSNGNIDWYSQYVFRNCSGVWRVTKSMKSKSGNYVKTPIIENEEFITDYPKEICKLIFGHENLKSLLTFESLLSEIMSKNFIHKSKRDQIINKFLYYLKSGKLEIPQELNMYNVKEVNV